MTGVTRLGAVSVDCADPIALGEFYRRALNLSVGLSSDDFVALQGHGVWLTFHRVADHRRPDWPDGPVPQQLHLDLAVSDLDVEEARLVELGAHKAEAQPNPDNWRVLIDPA